MTLLGFIQSIFAPPVPEPAPERQAQRFFTRVQSGIGTTPIFLAQVPNRKIQLQNLGVSTLTIGHSKDGLADNQGHVLKKGTSGEGDGGQLKMEPSTLPVYVISDASDGICSITIF